jgi:hypothetical protein
MALKISNNSLFKRHVLSVDSGGVRFCESLFLSGTARFSFRSIECVLLSADHILSFQVGNDLYRIPTNPANPRHQEVIATLLQEVRRSAADEPAPTGAH